MAEGAGAVPELLMPTFWAVTGNKPENNKHNPRNKDRKCLALLFE
jgi:hypothetical protein